MMTLLILIGVFFLLGWVVAIIGAIRIDWREHCERRDAQTHSRV